MRLRRVLVSLFVVLDGACVDGAAYSGSLFNKAQITKHQARQRSGLTPFQLVEDFGAEGLPGVVGGLGVEDAGLEDAGGAAVALEGILQTDKAFGTLAEFARAEALDPSEFEHMDRAPGRIGEVRGIEYQRQLARDFVTTGSKDGFQREAGGDVAFVGRVTGDGHDRAGFHVVPFEVEDGEFGAIRRAVIPLGSAVGAVQFNGGSEFAGLAEVFRGGREGEDRSGGGLDREMPPQRDRALAEGEEGDEDES